VSGVAGGRRQRSLGGALLALSLGCTLFNLGGVAFSPGGSDGGYVSVLLAASSIALLLALILIVNVRLAALFLGGLTGAFLVVGGAAITIQKLIDGTGSAPWLGPLILAAGALAVSGIIVGRRRRALGSALLSLSIGCILLLNAIFLLTLYGFYLVFLFGPPIIPLALALLITVIPQRPPPTTL